MGSGLVWSFNTPQFSQKNKANSFNFWCSTLHIREHIYKKGFACSLKASRELEKPGELRKMALVKDSDMDLSDEHNKPSKLLLV